MTWPSKPAPCYFGGSPSEVATASALAATIAAAPALAGPTVKLGSDSGQLVFDPADITISKGDSVTWVNNKGYLAASISPDFFLRVVPIFQFTSFPL